MRILYMALSAALAGVALAGCSDSGGSSTPAASQAQPAETPIVAQAAGPVVEEQADRVTEEQPDAAVGGEGTAPGTAVQSGDAMAPASSAPALDIATAPVAEVRRELRELRPVAAEIRKKYLALRDPLRQIRADRKRAAENGDEETETRLRAQERALTRQFRPVRDEFHETRDRIRAMRARLEAESAEPGPADASN